MKTKKASSHQTAGCGSSAPITLSSAGTETEWLVNGILDVRALPPARRHSLIFQTYRNLAAGDSFVLTNDHDPKPLYYQFAAEHEGAFTWAYEEQGPEVWRVRIGKTKDAKAA